MTDIVPLLDAEGSFATLREAFGIDDDAPWRLPFHAFLVRRDAGPILVDTGVGPPGEDPFLPERQGRLPDELARAGVAPEEIELVLLTHLHVDHVGWNTTGGEPTFPNARYVAHRADFEWVTATRGDRPYVRDNVAGLAGAGVLDLVDGDGAEPATGVRLVRTGGHTPGHCIVELDGVTLAGDLAVSRLQLADPTLAYAAEEDPAAIAAERARRLPALASSGGLVGFAHLGLGRVTEDGAGFASHGGD